MFFFLIFSKKNYFFILMGGCYGCGVSMWFWCRFSRRWDWDSPAPGRSSWAQQKKKTSKIFFRRRALLYIFPVLNFKNASEGVGGGGGKTSAVVPARLDVHRATALYWEPASRQNRTQCQIQHRYCKYS